MGAGTGRCRSSPGARRHLGTRWLPVQPGPRWWPGGTQGSEGHEAGPAATGSDFCETGWNGRPRRRHICWAGGPGIWDIVFLAGSGGCQKPDKLITSDMGQSSFWRVQAGPPEPLSGDGAAAPQEFIARRWGWRGTGRGLRPCPHLPLLWPFAEQGPSDTVLG